MNGELQRLAARRQRLVAQAAAQRAVLAQQAAPWRARFALADRGVAVLRYVHRHPALLAVTGVLVAVLRPRYSGIWLQRGLMLWQIVSSLRAAKK